MTISDAESVPTDSTAAPANPEGQRLLGAFCKLLAESFSGLDVDKISPDALPPELIDAAGQLDAFWSRNPSLTLRTAHFRGMAPYADKTPVEASSLPELLAELALSKPGLSNIKKIGLVAQELSISQPAAEKAFAKLFKPLRRAPRANASSFHLNLGFLKMVCPGIGDALMDLGFKTGAVFVNRYYRSFDYLFGAFSNVNGEPATDNPGLLRFREDWIDEYREKGWLDKTLQWERKLNSGKFKLNCQFGFRALWKLAEAGNTQGLRTLLDAGFEPSNIDGRCGSILHLAAHSQNAQCCAMLAERFPHMLRVKDIDGMEPWQIALSAANKPLAAQLTSVDAAPGKSGITQTWSSIAAIESLAKELRLDQPPSSSFGQLCSPVAFDKQRCHDPFHRDDGAARRPDPETEAAAAQAAKIWLDVLSCSDAGSEAASDTAVQSAILALRRACVPGGWASKPDDAVFSESNDEIRKFHKELPFGERWRAIRLDGLLKKTSPAELLAYAQAHLVSEADAIDRRTLDKMRGYHYGEVGPSSHEETDSDRNILSSIDRVNAPRKALSACPVPLDFQPARRDIDAGGSRLTLLSHIASFMQIASYEKDGQSVTWESMAEHVGLEKSLLVRPLTPAGAGGLFETRLESSGGAGLRWSFENGVWKRGITQAVAFSCVVDGQEFICASIRGTQKSGKHSLPRFLPELALDYAHVGLHERKLRPLLDEIERVAAERGAKVMLCGHSLGGGAVEAALARRPNVDVAFVYGSCSARGLPGGRKDPRLFSIKDAFDPVPILGKFALYNSKAQTVVSVTRHKHAAFSGLVARAASAIASLKEEFKGGPGAYAPFAFETHGKYRYGEIVQRAGDEIFAAAEARSKLRENQEAAKPVGPMSKL